MIALKLFSIIIIFGLLFPSADFNADADETFLGGVGVFLPTRPLDQPKLDYVETNSERAKNYGLSFANLIVDWNDLEPIWNEYNGISNLLQFMNTIRSFGLKVVLRVYFNAGYYHQAAPNWLFDKGIEFVSYNGYRQSLPWDDVYQKEVGELLTKISQEFQMAGSYPDAMQISLGGAYGEMHLPDYSFNDETLVEAEKWHIESFSDHFETFPLIISINSLSPNDP